MRCPNCGNENPPDYMFCDECGARLLGGEEAPASAAASTPSADMGIGSSGSQVYEPADVAGMSQQQAGQMDVPTGSVAPAQPVDIPRDSSGDDSPVPMVAYSGQGQGAMDGSVGGLGHETPDESDLSYPVDEAGSYAAQAAPGGDGYTDQVATPGLDDTIMPQAGGMQPGVLESDGLNSGGMSSGSLSSSGLQSGGLSSGGMSPADVASGGLSSVDLASESISPADMTPEGGTQDDSAGTPSVRLYGTQTGQEGMPGVMPVAEDEMAPAVSAVTEDTVASGGDATSAPAMDSSGAAPEPAGSQPEDTWAIAALGHLEEAQQAIAGGNWGEFGSAMSRLRSYLETIARGVPSGVPGMAPSAGITGMSTGGGSSASSAPAPTPAYPAGPAAGGANIGAVSMPEPVAPMAGMSTNGQAGSTDGTGSAARLVVISTGAEMLLPEQEEITVGREDPSSGIFPDIDLTPYGGEDGGVSRRHARLLHVGGDYFVEDLQSTNYTKLDGQRLPAHVRERLEDGARLDFGRIAMIFRQS